jgi:G3E family GTPase
VQLLLNNPLVSHFLRLDTIVTTVDAVDAPHQLDRQYEAVKQVALADRLLVTKRDLVEDVGAPELRLRQLNPALESKPSITARSIRQTCSAQA